MSGSVIETVMGAVVIAVAALFLFFAYTTSRVGAVSGYPLTAQFSSVAGLTIGSDVRLAGVKIGTVTGETLDPKTFLATIHMTIERQYKLPEDTVAKIVSPGLLGDKYLDLVPGGADHTIPPGGRIKYTQASVNLEDLIGQMMYSPSGGAGKAGGGSAQPSPGNSPAGLGLGLPPPAGHKPAGHK
ncbi:MAG TPA: outer membrane lipid asymmetry maintenance protein MlaD [Stellaceae bacterium]|nr:outer membrane lipid asymmetry maintenance protein MlaD [Stellaceae bacterium]